MVIRANPARVTVAASDRAARGVMATGESRQPFTWPPVPVAEGARDAVTLTARAAAASTRLERMTRAWARIEECWLDPVALPLPRRAAAEGWRPDEPSAYCDRCGRTIGAFEAGEFGCARCARERPPWSHFVRLGEYDPPLAEWIADVKFTRWSVLGFELGRWLGRRVREAGFVPGRDAIVVPVPTTWRRVLTRGIDHASAIASGAARELGCPLRQPLKRKHRPSQRAVAPSQRERNVANSFRCVRPGDVRGRSVLLIDDVMTTGATLRGAARALRTDGEGPKEVWACVLGVTPLRGERPSP